MSMLQQHAVREKEKGGEKETALWDYNFHNKRSERNEKKKERKQRKRGMNE